MILNKLQAQTIKLRNIYRAFTTLPEYTDTPEYPPIEELSYAAKRQKKVEKWSEEIKNCKTVEEKQMKVNMPKYYGWKSIIFNDKLIPYNSLPFIQYCTKTHLEVSKLGEIYDKLGIDKYVSLLSPIIQDAILIEHDLLRHFETKNFKLSAEEKENLLSDAIVKQINRIILNNLCEELHLKNIQVDYEARHEGFWFLGGVDPPENSRKSREKIEWLKERAEEPINRAVQYLGSPSLALRSEVPLKPFLDFTEVENPKYKVPNFTYDPRVLGFNSENRHGTNIPGFWPGDPYEYGFLSYQRMGHLRNRSRSFGAQDDLNALHGQAILSSFAWTNAQANFHGFTSYNDLKYPFGTQTVLTNGRKFNFYGFQLNTISFHQGNYLKNARNNVCWFLGDGELFSGVSNGKIEGYNQETLKQLIGFYLNVHESSQSMKSRCYLGQDAKFVAEIEDEEKRTWLEAQYKHMMSNRPRHRALYEVYHWEKIYKIDHKTRILEPRRRPFELRVNPWQRRYDERSPSYIPKALRPGGPKSKPKFYKSYYP